MKVIRTFFTILACCLIALGLASVLIYQFGSKPAASEPAAQPQPTVAAQPEQTETPEEPEQDETNESTDPTDAKARELLSGMSLSEKIYQLFFIEPEAITGVATVTQAGETTQEALQNFPVGGIVYSQQNLEDSEQVTDMLTATQSYMNGQTPLFLAIDEEGGDNAPVADTLDTTAFPSMAELGEEGDADTVEEMGSTIAGDISRFGFNVNLAPVADLATNDDNTLIGNRSFGADADLAATLVGAEVRGLQQSGKVLAAATHFPGIGSASDVAHITPTIIDKTSTELQDEDLKPFVQAISEHVGFIIVSHSIVTGLDNMPCSLSQAAMQQLLRDELGYEGIILTDALDVPAITDTYSSGEAAVKALSAGADMLLCPESLLDAYDGIQEALDDGTLTEERIDESVLRILKAKFAIGLLN